MVPTLVVRDDHLGVGQLREPAHVAVAALDARPGLRFAGRGTVEDLLGRDVLVVELLELLGVVLVMVVRVHGDPQADLLQIALADRLARLPAGSGERGQQHARQDACGGHAVESPDASGIDVHAERGEQVPACAERRELLEQQAVRARDASPARPEHVRLDQRSGRHQLGPQRDLLDPVQRLGRKDHEVVEPNKRRPDVAVRDRGAPTQVHAGDSLEILALRDRRRLPRDAIQEALERLGEQPHDHELLMVRVRHRDRHGPCRDVEMPDRDAPMSHLVPLHLPLPELAKLH